MVLGAYKSMVLAMAAAYIGFSAANKWHYKGTQPDFAAVISQIVNTEPASEIIFGTVPANTKVDLDVDTDKFASLMFSLSQQTSLRFARHTEGKKRHWFIVWGDGDPVAGQVRIYEQANSYYVDGKSVSLRAIGQQIQHIFGVDAVSQFAAMGADVD